MAKNRKLHRKQCRLNGERRKIEHQKQLAHKRDLEVLRRVMDYTDQLRIEHPQLFEDVMRVVDKLADETGVTREDVLTKGTLVMGDDGEQIAKSPADILREIAEARANISAAMAANGVESLAPVAVTRAEVDALA